MRNSLFSYDDIFYFGYFNNKKNSECCKSFVVFCLWQFNMSKMLKK